MKPANLLQQHGLARNPFTDRTAENTQLDPLSLYEHSDLQHFKPSNETYIFFGRRGSGKTTVRMAMQRAYERANEELVRDGGEPHFVVDLCRPGHMTACLKDFQVPLLRLPLPRCTAHCFPMSTAAGGPGVSGVRRRRCGADCAGFLAHVRAVTPAVLQHRHGAHASQWRCV